MEINKYLIKKQTKRKLNVIQNNVFEYHVVFLLVETEIFELWRKSKTKTS